MACALAWSVDCGLRLVVPLCVPLLAGATVALLCIALMVLWLVVPLCVPLLAGAHVALLLMALMVFSELS